MPETLLCGKGTLPETQLLPVRMLPFPNPPASLFFSWECQQCWHDGVEPPAQTGQRGTTLSLKRVDLPGRSQLPSVFDIHCLLIATTLIAVVLGLVVIVRH
jgi:hypothetical protein